MKKTSTLLAISSALVLSNAAQAEIEGEVHVGFNSDYVFRGADLGSEAVEVGADINGSLSCGIDWSAGVWYIDPSNSSGVEEIDFYGELSKDVGFGTLAIGYINYQYLNTGLSNDQEVYLSGTTSFADLDATLLLTHAFEGGFEGSFLIEGFLSKSFELSDKFSIEASLSAGYLLDEGDSTSAYGDDGYAYGSASLTGTYTIDDQISISPYVSYTDGERDVHGAVTFNGFYGGVSAAISF